MALCIFKFLFNSGKEIDFEFINDDSFRTTTIFEFKNKTVGLITQNFGEELDFSSEEGGTIYLVFDQKNFDWLIFEVEVISKGTIGTFFFILIVLAAVIIVVLAFVYFFTSKKTPIPSDYHAIEMNDEPIRGEKV